MPATNFSWPSERQEVLQMFGTKRKSPTEHAEHESVDGLLCKRLCIQSEVNISSCSDEGMDSTDSMHESHQTNQLSAQNLEAGAQTNGTTNGQPRPVFPTQNDSHIQMCNQKSEQFIMQLWNNRVPPLPDVTHHHDNTSTNENNNSEMNNNNHQTHPFYNQPQQDDMLMELHDEIYTSSTLPCNDSVTTDAEYEAACSMAAMEGEGAPDHTQYRTLAFCDQYCSGGHTSPSTGKVRCFCKPSWEGLTNHRPYETDYY